MCFDAILVYVAEQCFDTMEIEFITILRSIPVKNRHLRFSKKMFTIAEVRKYVADSQWKFPLFRFEKRKRELCSWQLFSLSYFKCEFQTSSRSSSSSCLYIQSVKRDLQREIFNTFVERNSLNFRQAVTQFLAVMYTNFVISKLIFFEFQSKTYVLCLRYNLFVLNAIIEPYVSFDIK